MASYNLTPLTLSGYTAVNDGKTVRCDSNGFMTRKIDFAKFLVAAGIANFTQNDLIAVLPIKKGTLVQFAGIIVKKNDTAAGAVTVGLGDAVTGNGMGIASLAASSVGWCTAANIKTATLNVPIMPDIASTNYLYGSAAALGNLGKMYSADGSLDIKILGTTTAMPIDAQIIVFAKILEMPHVFAGNGVKF